MRRINFFKARSRLGMLNIPHKGTEKNWGVENGPDAILSKDFLALFENHVLLEYDFPLPESINPTDYYKTITRTSSQFRDLILREADSGVQVVIGGDHSTAFPSFLAVLERFPASKIGYIQFDTHADINLVSSSPTGNFHGMFVRPFITWFDDPDINTLVKQRLPSTNLLYIGNLDLDHAEVEVISEENIRCISGSDIRNSRKKTIQKVKEFIHQFEHLHISFDIDVFAAALAPATGTPNPNGLHLEDIFPILEILTNHPDISIDLVEVNPQKVGSAKTIKLAQTVLIRLLRHDTISHKSKEQETESVQVFQHQPYKNLDY